jgi:integrase
VQLWGHCRTCKSRRGLRRHSAAIVAGLRPQSVAQYQRVLYPLLVWLQQIGVRPEHPYEWDDLLCEYRSGSDGAPVVSKSNFEKTLAAIERVLPHVKGQLGLAHAELNSWKVAVKPRHAVPLTPPHAFLLAEAFLNMGMPLVAAALLLQCLTGLRPGELLGLRREHLLPPWAIPGGCLFATLLLGTSHGTKSGRPQSVRVDSPLGIWLVTLLHHILEPGAALTHLHTLSGYAYLLQVAARKVHPSLAAVGWKPHSPRAGFCTWLHLHGLPAAEIMETTRHISIRSFRIYLDTQAVTAGQIGVSLQPWQRYAEALMTSLPHRLHARLMAGREMIYKNATA